MQLGNVGHLVGIGVNVGLPLFLLCVGRALMMSCAVVSIAGSTVGGWAWHRDTGGFGKCRDFTEIQQSPQYRDKQCVRAQSDKNPDIEKLIGKKINTNMVVKYHCGVYSF